MKYVYMMDSQQIPPAGWCPICGCEIYAEGENLCSRCRKEAESDVFPNV